MSSDSGRGRQGKARQGKVEKGMRKTFFLRQTYRGCQYILVTLVSGA
jgi:hypothetical protein